jgi:hypothetical protein
MGSNMVTNSLHAHLLPPPTCFYVVAILGYDDRTESKARLYMGPDSTLMPSKFTDPLLQM